LSAIAGIFFLDDRVVDRLILERMVNVLAHRGRDGAGAWSEGSIGLGHRMLHTTPESLREKLPLANKSGNLVLTADARLDNRDELITALGFGRRPREEITDSELIFGAYERWGERCPEKLLGDFTFAIWDRQRQELFCARDHMGVKPFYYYRSDRAFVFASEIKALLCVPGVPRRLNEVRVADYLVPILEDKEITFYQGILRLPSAHSTTVNRERVSIQPYWSLDPSREVRFRSDEEYAEAFREIFTEAVRCRLRSAFPAGSLLSGGLDSSSIVCVARDLLAEEECRLHTFSAVFPNVPESDESVFSGAVLAQGGLEPHLVRADRLSPLDDLESILWHNDEVFWAPNLYMHWGLYSAADRRGVRILLDGDGGDATVSHGVERLRELALWGRWIALATEIRGLSKHFDVSPWYYLRNHVLIPVAPGPVRRAWRVARRRTHPPWWTPSTIINPDFARRIGVAERVRALEGEWWRPTRASREVHWRILTNGLNQYLLELCDKAAAAFAIEPRYPFFDRRLAEFCLALPPDQKLRDGWIRVIVRRALAGSLPEEVRWRGGKGNLGHNLNRNLPAFEQDLLEETISKDSGAIEEYVDVATLRKAYDRYVSQNDLSDAVKVFTATNLALWLRWAGIRS
jgi:asparagine synthase (glutamine-hydrolysing)